MTGTIYYQWQNEFLLKSIYPLREQKLRDFLVHYEEIDLWKKHQDMTQKELVDWKKKYEEKQARILADMARTYDAKEAYFTKNTEDAVAKYAANYEHLDGEELDRVKKLHDDFATYLHTYKDSRKKKIFIAQRVAAWEQYRKVVNVLILGKRRRVNIINANVKDAESKGDVKLRDEFQKNLTVETNELNRLENELLKMVEEEYELLNEFSSSYNKIEKRETEVKKEIEGLQAKKKDLLDGLGKVWMTINQAEDELRSVQGWLKRFKDFPTQKDIKAFLGEVEKKVLSDVDWTAIGQVFGGETKFFDRFKGVHEYLVGMLKNLKGSDVKLIFVVKLMENLNNIKKDMDRQIADREFGDEQKNSIPVLRAILSHVIVPELERLEEYHFALDRDTLTRTDEKVKADLAQKEARVSVLQKTLEENRSHLAGLQTELAQVKEKLAVPERERRARYVPEKEITREVIVMNMAEEYRASLEGKSQYELLEMIVQRFWDDPDRYPLWLQYMVIHFSGMRYASAHGSWADPKELLLNLRTSMVVTEFRTLTDKDDVNSRCDAKKSLYESPAAEIVVPGESLPKFATSKNQADREKIKGYIVKLGSDNLYEKRNALFNLRLEEERYEIEAMRPEEVLEALTDLREQAGLPDWMWKEIVAMTDLRVKEARHPNWEKLTPEEEVERSNGKWAKYREIMNEWKAKDITGWRKEHEETGQLVVTRAVCNEVAEHIQHMRGHKGAAGLTEKPNWYKDEERKWDKKFSVWNGPRPYFKRPKKVEDFKEGASILWLRFVGNPPNQWQVAKDLETIEGDGLIRPEYLGRRGPGHWTYTINDEVKRNRVVVRDRVEYREKQYLRWMHEATVAEVAKTAEGDVVLTFETALPYEDRRLSTIGLLKRYPGDLMHDQGEDGYNPAFVGFVPEAELSEERLRQLKEMLDWNKILLREFKPPAKLKAFQEKYIRSKAAHPTSGG